MQTTNTATEFVHLPILGCYFDSLVYAKSSAEWTHKETVNYAKTF
jgi:hypothetical protein